MNAWMQLGIGVGAINTMVVLGALLASGDRLRRSLALIPCAVALWLPTLADPSFRAVRAFLALGAGWGVMTVLELMKMKRTLSPSLRVWHALALFDTRVAKRIPRRFDIRALAHSLLFLAIWAALLWSALHTENRPLRWVLAAAFGYTAWESFSASVLFINRALGVEPPVIHDNPIASRTIREFWNKRWNQTVSGWLRRMVFRPFARKRRFFLGMIATYAVSGLLHAYFTWVALDLYWAGIIASFFLLQIVFISVERALKVDRWPTPLSRLWTFTLLLVASPLHMEPLLLICDWRLITS